MTTELSIGERLDPDGPLAFEFSLDRGVLDLPELFARDLALVKLLTLGEELERTWSLERR